MVTIMLPSKLSLVFGLLGLGALLPACALDELDTGSVQQDIIGGTTADIANYPTVVALENGPRNWFCTGTLIDPSWILTAAHCVEAGEGEPAQTVTGLKIRFDDNNVNDSGGGMEVAVAEIHGDTEFDWDLWDNDIALVKLATPITDREVTPIDRDAVAFGTAVTDVGYGAASNNENNDMAGILRQVGQTTVDCSGAGDTGISNDNIVCMDSTNGKGSCYGDSGGPAFAMVNGKRVVVGITSGAEGDCGDSYDLYTSVHAELAFVDSVMGVVDPDPADPDPTDPDPMDPDPTQPTEPTGGDDTAGGTGEDTGGGCNTGGQLPGGAIIFAAIGLVAVSRRKYV